LCLLALMNSLRSHNAFVDSLIERHDAIILATSRGELTRDVTGSERMPDSARSVLRLIRHSESVVTHSVNFLAVT
jgi:hypothetical protein